MSGYHFEIGESPLADLLPLRQRVLRPELAAEYARFDGDGDPSTLHIAARLGGDVVGVASLFRVAPPEREPHSVIPVAAAAGLPWQLRGMATEHDYRGRGVGRWMVAACLQHVFDAGGGVVWCNARTEAAGFYERLGFTVDDSEF